MKIAMILIALVFSACTQTPAPETKVEKPPMIRDAAADEFIKRMAGPGAMNLQQSALRTLSTDYSDFDKVDAVMKQGSAFLGALGRYEKGDPTSLEEYGGVTAFKEKCAGWLKDDEQSIRAYAAVMLGIGGDPAFAARLSEVLNPRQYQKRDSVQYDRGRAAIALGMIGAVEYKAQLAKMLTSGEYNDRQGGALGLGFLKAKEYASDVAKLQDDKEPNVRNDARAALRLMGADELIRK
jgi:hypothetical protein